MKCFLNKTRAAKIFASGMFALCAVLVPGLCAAAAPAKAASVVVIKDGKSRAVIVVAPELIPEEEPAKGKAVKKPKLTAEELDALRKLRFVRDSVDDLAMYLEKMSGAKIEIVAAPLAAGDRRLPIYVGDTAVQKFGPMTLKDPASQGFRVVVANDGIGLMGENYQSTSFAIYEMLERLGCRWMMPSDLGEVIPEQKTITMPIGDVSSAPGTLGRFLWHLDPVYLRRIRNGGSGVSAGHALENHSKGTGDYGYLTLKQLEEHPDWNAMFNGKRSVNGRFCWGNTEVSDAVADSIIARLHASHSSHVSLSPQDGSNFCECEKCKALDTGDFDPVMNTMSITDRFVNFCNRIATRVTKTHPDVQFGFLAYVQFTQAPVREKLHPNLAVQLAPINYCRAHAMTDDCVSRQRMRKIVEDWGKATSKISYYQYMFNLAEYTAPYPMMHQMSVEQPIIYANNVKYWQPEGMTNLDQILPGHYISNRMAWNPKANPAEILDEFFIGFYGAASQTMRKYWTLWDDAWTKVDEHAGANWAYPRRFTPEFMKAARAAMDEATAAAKTPLVARRVKLQDESLRQMELFMSLRWDLNEGRLETLGTKSKQWLARQIELGSEYQAQGAFSKIRWTPHTAGGHWFVHYMQPPYLDAGRISETNNWISPPLRNWKYAQDKPKTGEEQGWHKADFDDATWKTTDVGIETWNTLGLQDFYGPVWYRMSVPVKAIPAGKKTFLWIPATDGQARVFVNGQAIPYVNAKGETKDRASGYGAPFSFDISSALKPGAQNQITIEGTHIFINELGTGGLLGPTYLYQEK